MNSLYSQKLPAATALQSAWNLLSTAENDWDKASWAPAMPYNTLTELWQAWGAFEVAERIGGLEDDILQPFRDRWNKLYDAQQNKIKVEYVRDDGEIRNTY